ncbi:MAG: eukaryotic-like serine/threonine-protein kinase [Solirubrobacteraceae bacterium]|nr:eukaryotic-like serine/threonine-protein kinase [Solirubrobacteraceae bacterium]
MVSMTVAGVHASWCNFPANGRFPACESKDPSLSTPNAEPVSHAHPSAAAAHSGEIVLDRYRLVRRIGAGGMGVVYLAHDEHLERAVAVKRIAAELDPDGRGEREAIAAARLSHPGIVALYESGRDADAVYLVSELVRGRTLAELIAAGELSDRDVVRIGVTLCDALEHAHARGVIHRDVKPSNVICPATPHDGAGVAKLTDFGIARMADGDALTRTGDIMGTLAYMAPEQASGLGVTGAADVYGLGVVLYEGLSGINPIRAGNPAATARRVGMALPPLQRVRRDLPAGLCRAIDAAVQPEPARRAGLGSLRLALSHAVEVVGDAVGPVDSGDGTGRTARLPPDRTLPHDAVPPRGGGRAARRAAATQPARERAPLFDPPAFEQAASGPRRPRGRGRSEREPPPAPLDEAPEPARLRAWGSADAPDRARRGPWGLADAPEPSRRRPWGWRLRAPAAAGAALLAAAALARLGPAPPLAPAAAALAAGTAVVVLPRLGWLAMVALLEVWLAATAPGLALLVALAAAPVPLLLPRRGVAWSLPAVAPLIGLAGLAGAWPALAGQARHWTTRAALGALGGLWLVLAEALTSERLLFGQPRDVLAAPAWDGSALDATRDALVPLLAGGTLAIALLWGLAAALLPVLVRGRSAALDLVAAAGWAAMLAAATRALGDALLLDPPRGLAVGAVLAGAVAVGARAVRGGT